MTSTTLRMYKNGQIEHEYTPEEKEIITKVIVSENPEILKEIIKLRHEYNVLKFEVFLTIFILIWYKIFTTLFQYFS